jgi:hypothetical protein
MTIRQLPTSLIDWQPARCNGDLRPDQHGLDWIVVRQAAGATILGCKIELTPDQQRLKSPAQTHNPAGSTAKYP